MTLSTEPEKRQAAMAALAAFRIAPNLTRAAALADAAEKLLADAGGTVHACPEAQTLAEVKAVLDVYDWASDDPAFAVQQIEDIIRGDQR